MQDKFIEQIEKKFKVPDRVANKLQIRAEKVHGGYLVYEYRPRWDNEKERLKFDVAKIIFRKDLEKYLLYWKRASGKWELLNEYKTFTSALGALKKDKFGCFWG